MAFIDNLDWTCPHCHQRMQRWSVGEDIAMDGMGWGVPEMLVCFNDQCPVFVNAWTTMHHNFGRLMSQRFFRNPFDGDQGTLPVGHKDALKGTIIQDDAPIG